MGFGAPLLKLGLKTIYPGAVLLSDWREGLEITAVYRINLEENVNFPGLTTGLERYRFIHRALPELDLDAIDLGQELFGKRLAVPLLISSMTGGTEQAGQINRTLAAAAEQAGVAMRLGSQRAALEHPELADTFRVREVAPTALLFANLGAVQLNYSYGVDECRRAVEMIEADALILHLHQHVRPSGGLRPAARIVMMRARRQRSPASCP